MDDAKRFAEGTLVIASHNAGKVVEIADLLRPFGVQVKSAGALGLPEPDETGATFVENALLKARAAAEAAHLPALADDSGLVVPALGGRPGIESARWAGPKRDFALAMQKVEDALARSGPGGTPPRDRRASFACALALCWPDGPCSTFEGDVRGTLVWPPRGTKGFGYDPMFRPDGHDMTFGEMDPAGKHRISHRAIAFRKLVDACFERC
ncbi:MAG: RdgB/HAM1 family non-canonical purine NTP pyrophosphatase [Rhodospirillales bacterium]|nr:RdgB/HAM1 family non-canonical purine NTP pyrophosphatase [Rhodospirillales bacterium]